jgi:hypothetical protein
MTIFLGYKRTSSLVGISVFMLFYFILFWGPLGEFIALIDIPLFIIAMISFFVLIVNGTWRWLFSKHRAPDLAGSATKMQRILASVCCLCFLFPTLRVSLEPHNFWFPGSNNHMGMDLRPIGIQLLTGGNKSCTLLPELIRSGKGQACMYYDTPLSGGVSKYPLLHRITGIGYPYLYGDEIDEYFRPSR